MMTDRDLIIGEEYIQKRGSEVYIRRHKSRQMVIFEDEEGQEHSATLRWAAENWEIYDPPIEGQAWYCKKCKDFYRKTVDLTVNKCKNDGTDMILVFMVEILPEQSEFEGIEDGNQGQV